jgi:hypothetical protein
VLVHYASARRTALQEIVAGRNVAAQVGVPDLQVTIDATGVDPGAATSSIVDRVEVG